MKRIRLLVFFCFAITIAYAQEAYVTIPLSNSSPDGVGYTESESDLWRPPFFDVDNSGLIHVPDFYKSRIAVFDASGTIAAEYPCAAEISPRMNFFGLLHRDAESPL